MRRVLLAVFALIIALVLGGWLVLRHQAQTYGEGLVRDAVALEARTFELAGTEGSVMDCLGRAADVSPDISRSVPWTLPEVMAVTAGRTALTPLTRTELENNRAWLGATLACAQLKTVAVAPGLGPFADVRHGRRQTMPRLMESLTALAPISMREAMERSVPGEALETCSEVLTLTTSWLRLEGLEAMLPTLGASRTVLPACHDALMQVSEEERLRFRARAAELLALSPEYPEVMALERTQLGLRLFGAWLPPELDVQLPDSARLITKTQRDTRFDRGVRSTLALRLYWRRFDAGMREVEAVSSLPPATRASAILAAQSRLDAPFLRRFFTADPVDLRYQMYAVYLDQLRATLGLLSGRAP